MYKTQSTGGDVNIIWSPGCSNDECCEDFFFARFVAKRYQHRNLMSVMNTSERLWQQLNKIQHLGVVFPAFLSWRKAKNIILFLDDVYSSENKEAVGSAWRLLR
jgi:hypothetical protein